MANSHDGWGPNEEECKAGVPKIHLLGQIQPIELYRLALDWTCTPHVACAGAQIHAVLDLAYLWYTRLDPESSQCPTLDQPCMLDPVGGASLWG